MNGNSDTPATISRIARRMSGWRAERISSPRTRVSVRRGRGRLLLAQRQARIVAARSVAAICIKLRSLPGSTSRTPISI